MNVQAAWIIAIGFVAGGLLLGGVYETSQRADANAIFIINRFTGSVTFCGAGSSGCRPIPPAQ
jgi:hypothetical protein